MAGQISTAVDEQTQVSEDISENVNRLAHLAGNSAEKVEHSAQKSNETHLQIEELSNLLKQFKL